MATGIPGIDTILDVANWTAENSTGIAKLAGISALNYFCPLAAVATATGISIYDNFPAISDWTRDIPNTATTDFEENLNTLLAVDQTSGAVNIAAEETVIAVMSALEGFVEFPLLLTGSTEWTNTEHRNQFQTTLAALRTLEARDIIPQNLRQQLNALRVVVQTYRHNQAGAIWRITDRVTVNSSVEIRRLSIALSSLTPGEHDRANVQQIVTMLRNHTVVTSERQSTYFNELVSALETLQQTPEGRVTITPPLRTFIGQSNVVFEEITRSQTSTRERIVDLAASRLPESVQSLVRTPQVAPPLLLRVYERLQHPVQEGDIQEIFRELRRAYPGITLAVPEDPTRANVIPCITAALQVRQQGDAYQLVIANREDLALPNSALSQLPESWQIEILQGQSNSQAVTETSWSPGALVERAQRELLSEPTPASGRLLEAYDQLLAVDQHTQTMLAASPAVVRELVQQLRTYAAYPLQLLRQGHWQNPEVPGRMNELANALDGILDGDQSIFLSEDIRNELSQARAALIEIRSRQNGRLRQVFEHRTNVSAVIEQRQGFLRDFLDLQSFSRETLEAAIAHFREVPEIFSEDTQHYQMIVRELESLNADSPILLPQALRGLLESTKFIYEQIEITQQDVFTRVTEFLPEAFRPGSQTPQEAVHPLIQVFVALEREEQLTAESYALLLGLLDTVNPDLRSILPEELPQNAEVRNAITQHLAERGQHPEQPDRQAIPGSTLASMPEPWQRAVIETPRRLEAVATSIPSVLGTISTAATAYLSGSGAAPADSPGALAIVTSLVSGTEGTILERITQALSTLPAHIQTGTYQVILSGLKLALESERLTTWITGQSRLTEEQQEALEADIRDAITLLTQIQENPIDTARHLPQHVLTGLGITNAEQDITTDTRAIELATNYIRNQFSTYVVHSNGMAIPGLNATTAPPRNLTEMHSEMTRDLDRLTPTESIPLDSAQLDQELNVQKEAFIKNSTAFAAFQAVEWALGAPNHRAEIDAEIRAEMTLSESDPDYFRTLQELRRARGYYDTPNVFAEIMGEIRHYSPEMQLEQFKSRYKERIDERTDLNWFQKTFAKALLSFSMWGFQHLLQDSFSKLTSFIYDEIETIDEEVEVNITPIKGLKNFLMGYHRGLAQWVSDTSSANRPIQNTLLDKDPYLDHILRNPEFNNNYSDKELNETLSDVLVDQFFPELGWSSSITKYWTEGLWSFCSSSHIDATGSFAVINYPLNALKFAITSPIHAIFGATSSIVWGIQAIASVGFKWVAKKALRDTALVTTVLESSRGSLYENSPHNLAINEITLEQLKEVYKELRRQLGNSEEGNEEVRVRVKEPSDADLEEILGFVDNLFEVQKTIDIRTPAQMEAHLSNNHSYFEQLSADLRRMGQSAYEPDVKKQIGLALMVVYQSFLQPDQIKKQVANILDVSNKSMTESAESLSPEARAALTARGVRVEAEIKATRDNILNTIIETAIHEQISGLGQEEATAATAFDQWMKSTLLEGDANLLTTWQDALTRYESAQTIPEKQDALDQIKVSLQEYNDTMQMEEIAIRTKRLNAQTENLLLNRAHEITEKLQGFVNAFIPLYQTQIIIGTNQRESTIINLIGEHFAAIQGSIHTIETQGIENYEPMSQILSKVGLIQNLLEELDSRPVQDDAVNNLIAQIRTATARITEVGGQLRSAANNSIVLGRIQRTELTEYISSKRANLSSQNSYFGSISEDYTPLFERLKQSFSQLSNIQATALTQKLNELHAATTEGQITQLHGEFQTLVGTIRSSQRSEIVGALGQSRSQINQLQESAEGIQREALVTEDTTEEMNGHVRDSRAILEELRSDLNDPARRGITFLSADLVDAEGSVPTIARDYIFNEMQTATNRLLRMAKKGHLFEGAIRHAAIIPIIEQAGLSRI